MARTLVKEIKDKRKNYIINGAMEVAQRGTSFVSPGSGTYTLDRFIYFKQGAMTHTITQDADVPTLDQSGYTFKNSLRLNLTTPDTTIASNEFALIDQIIEGYNYSEFAQKAFTISFWVKATTPGTYSVAMRNTGDTRSLVYDYTINTANTWEKKIISVPAMNTSGTWNYTTGIGLRLSFVLAAGTSFQTTTGSWQNGVFIASTAQTNGVNTGATDFRLTGIMLNEGLTDNPFCLFNAGSFSEELIACQRYFEKSYNINEVPGTLASSSALYIASFATGSGTVVFQISYKVIKRSITHTVTCYNPATGAIGSMDRGGTPVNAVANNIAQSQVQIINNATTIANVGHLVHYTADAELS